jgi:hypothetical protein
MRCESNTGRRKQINKSWKGKKEKKKEESDKDMNTNSLRK